MVVDHEEDHVAGQARQAPRLDAEEIGGGETVPVVLQEVLPLRLGRIVRVIEQPMLLHDASDGLPGHVVLQGLELAVNAAVTVAA